MKQTLLHKYIEGETTASEERELKRLLLDVPFCKLTSDEKAVLKLLSFAPTDEDEEDIFAVDYTEEYNNVAKPRRTMHLWRYAVAVCMVGALFIGLTLLHDESPKVEGGHEFAEVNMDTSSAGKVIPEIPDITIANNLDEQTLAPSSKEIANHPCRTQPEMEVCETTEILDEIIVSPRFYHDLPYIINDVIRQSETRNVSLVQHEEDSCQSEETTEESTLSQ